MDWIRANEEKMQYIYKGEPRTWPCDMREKERTHALRSTEAAEEARNILSC
jgi:hypothetical protein